MWVCLPGLWRFPEDRIDGYGLAKHCQHGMNCRDLRPQDAGAGNKLTDAMLSDLKTGERKILEV
jgi:hypothetical protein